MLTVIMGATLLVGCGGNSSKGSAAEAEPGKLKGEITFWHSFTQGARLETIQAVADQFMKDNPDVKINIETFSWGDFYTKWTTGLASGNVPDMSTALPGHVVEMMDAEAIIPVDDVIDNIGRDKFSKSALSEGESVGSHYSLPLYSHAQVMWYRKDLLEAAGIYEYEKVQIVDVNNGNRFETYTIARERGTGMICLNGAAARCVSTGDKIILMAYCELNENEVKDHRPKVVFVDDNNKVERVTSYEKHGRLSDIIL